MPTTLELVKFQNACFALQALSVVLVQLIQHLALLDTTALVIPSLLLVQLASIEILLAVSLKMTVLIVQRDIGVP